MKKTYLHFANTTKSNLPKIISRRTRHGYTGSFHGAAYKSDGDDDEAEKLNIKLKSLETALEGKLTVKAKELVIAEIKSLSEEVTTLKANAGKPDQPTLDKIKSLEETIIALKAAADANQPVIDAFVKNPDRSTGDQRLKSFGDVLAETMTEATDDINKFARKEKKSLIIELKGIDTKAVGDVTTGNVTGGSRYGAQFAPQIINGPTRRRHIRSLLNVIQAGPGNTYTFMKENGTGEGAIAPVAEGATKPQIDLDLIEATVNFETIAGWLRVTRKAMNNIPGFIGYLQNRLPERLLRVEDAQILYGDGNTPNIKGIGTAGNFTAYSGGGGDLEEELISALSQLEDTNERYATGILVRPAAYYNFFKNKAGGSGEYDLPRNFVYIGDQLYISGVPVLPSTAVTAGDFFVGDWTDGADLMIQENMRIEFFEQDGTNVRENKVTVRIEETIALPVYGADYFIKGTDADQS